MFENISKSDVAVISLILLLTAAYIWHEYFREDKTTAAIGRLERQQAAVQSADKKVEARVATFENTRKNNDAKILQARRGAAESVRDLNTAGIVDGLRSELAWIRSRDRYGSLGGERERSSHPASGKGSSAGTEDAARGERGSDILSRIRAAVGAGAYSSGPAVTAGSSEGTRAVSANDSAASETDSEGESEDTDSEHHRRSGGDPSPGAVKEVSQ